MRVPPRRNFPFRLLMGVGTTYTRVLTRNTLNPMRVLPLWMEPGVMTMALMNGMDLASVVTSVMAIVRAVP